MRIAVLGATGFLGQPVARRLLADGYRVRVISRDTDKAREKLGDSFEYAQADLEDFSSMLLEDALDGSDALHMNLNSSSDERCRAIEYFGVEKAGKAAKKCGLKKISWVTGNFEPNPHHPWSRRALQSAGLEALKQCGVPYMIFSCTWFMESLKWFVQKDRALMVGEQPLDWHWLNSTDYTEMLSRAFSTTKSDNQHFVMHGPQPLKMLDALREYCKFLHPHLPVEAVTIAEAHELAQQPGMQHLDAVADFMEKFEIYGEWGDPAETNRILGTPTTTIEQWARRATDEAN
jgi:uncharacterized protein YbjT (DUF2867 family)